MSYFNSPVRVGVFMSAIRGLVERLIRVTGRREQLRIQVVFTGTVACAVWNAYGGMTVGTIKLPALRETGVIDRHKANVWVGYVIHEVWHIIFTSSHVWQRFCTGDGIVARRPSPMLRLLANAVEDARIERSGLELGYAEGFRVVGKDLLQHLMFTGGMNVNPNDPKQIPWAFAVGLRGYGVRGERRLLSALDPHVASIMGIAKAQCDAIDARISPMEGTHATIAIAEWVMSELKKLAKLPPPPPPEDEPPEGDDEGEGGDNPDDGGYPGRNPGRDKGEDDGERPPEDDTDADEEREPGEADFEDGDDGEPGEWGEDGGDDGPGGTEQAPLKVGDKVICPDKVVGRITAIEGDDATVEPL